MLYHLSFVEEAVMNPDYEGYIGGRVEVRTPDSEYAEEEIRFFTKKTYEFRKFREAWDFEYVNDFILDSLRNQIEEEYYDSV